ncbi:MAG: aminoacyl-tRNA hydrolase [Deltaproteobacteria bacterium]|nr:aminoacyl-tRNA hydrolase [Deltaproteobacteria bacterium]
MKLVVGLGNPGREYEGNRHNVGVHVLERLAGWLKTGLHHQKFEGLFGQADLGKERVYLLFPQTYMNLSGQSVAAAAHFYKVAPADILVIHDELDLPFGQLQLKAGGGSGGHNGLKSCTECLGCESYGRLRFGIGRPPGPGGGKDRVSGFVLSDFNPDERAGMEPLLDRAADMAEGLIKLGMATAMNRYNRKKG